jgi:hypothetical protein
MKRLSTQIIVDNKFLILLILVLAVNTILVGLGYSFLNKHMVFQEEEFNYKQNLPGTSGNTTAAWPKTWKWKTALRCGMPSPASSRKWSWLPPGMTWPGPSFPTAAGSRKPSCGSTKTASGKGSWPW